MQLSNLLERLLHDERSQVVESSLALLTQWLGDHDKSLPHDLENIAWQMLQRATGTGTPMLSYYWEQVGRALLPHELSRLVDLLLTSVENGDIPFNDARMNLLREAFGIDPAKTWGVMGDHLLLSERLPVMLEWWGQETGILEAQDADMLIAWCRVEPERRPAILARLVKPRAALSPLVRRLLIEFGSDSDAADQLDSNFHSGSWMGSMVEHERQQHGIARGWLSDPDPRVQTWAARIVRGIEANLPKLKQWEEEEFP